MSLILDALQQAEHERTQGAAPDVFAPTPPTASAPARLTNVPRRWGWPAIALLLAGALLWSLWRLQAPATAVATTAPAPAVAGGALFQPAAASAAPAAAAPERPAQAVAPAQPIAPALPPAVLPAPSSNLKPVPPAPPASPTTTPVAPALADLGTAERAGLPPLNITGHTYSDNPNLRMLMIDGHMVVEGQALAPGLRLERIGPHQSVFNHRGTRFSLDH